MNEAEYRAARPVCVLGETLVEELFGQQQPLGARIRLKSVSCEVVGVLEGKGQGAMGQDQDSVVVLPLSTLQRRLAGRVGSRDVDRMMISMQDGASADRVVRDVTEVLRERLQLGKLKLRGCAEAGRVVFHDSCYLGRWNGIFDAPRQLLRSINNNGNLIEMKRSAAEGLCCGAGGARMFMEESIGRRINHERAQEVIATGATQAAAACPFCITMLNDGIADLEGDVEVKDIAEILDEATE